MLSNLNTDSSEDSHAAAACRLGYPWGPMSATQPEAVSSSPCVSSPIVLPSTFLSPSFCYRLFHLSLFSTSSRSHYLCSLGTSVVQRQYGFFYYQVIHCVLCRQVKEFSATGLCMVSDLMHTRILQTCFHLPPPALCIPLHSSLAVKQGCGLEL